MGIVGVVLKLAYQLHRHFWLGWSLARWLGFLLAVAALIVLVRWWSYTWPGVLVAGVLLVYLLYLTWARRLGYVRFEASRNRALLGDASPGPPLEKEERVPLRASGWFVVEGKTQYYVDLAADFETVGTREHIVLARVRPSRFLLLGKWPVNELGWWYIFFQPAMIQKLGVGRLHFGPRPVLALEVTYVEDEEKPQTIYLAFTRATDLKRVRDDLLRDAPLKRVKVSDLG
ncbi:MAG: hypothetical protein PVI59_16590 [Anaerolineae bacterium]